MKVNLNQNYVDLKGEKFFDDGGKTKEVTFKDALIRAALYENPSKEQLTSEVKFKRYELARKLTKASGEVELSAEEIATIKKNAGNAFFVEACGSLCEILENSSVKNG